MAGSNQGGVEGGMSRAWSMGHPPITRNPDGTVQYDSSREPEALARPFEQNICAPFAALPDTLECMTAAPNPVTRTLGTGGDLLTPSNIRPDGDDVVGGSVWYKALGPTPRPSAYPQDL